MALAPDVARRTYPIGFMTGRVLNAGNPEAGVWVIAETRETNTPFIKIVVTDDQGRYFTRAFLGDYRVKVSRGQLVKEVTATLKPAGSTITVELE